MHPRLGRRKMMLALTLGLRRSGLGPRRRAELDSAQRSVGHLTGEEERERAGGAGTRPEAKGQHIALVVAADHSSGGGMGNSGESQSMLWQYLDAATINQEW